MSPRLATSTYLTQAATTPSTSNIVDCKLAMSGNVIVATVKKNRHATTLGASMIDNILYEGLDEIALNPASTLKEGTNTGAAKLRFPASNMLAVVVGTAGVNVLNIVQDISRATTLECALRTASAVNAQGRGTESHGRNENSGKRHSALLLVLFIEDQNDSLLT